jgi:hypothetical protein
MRKRQFTEDVIENYKMSGQYKIKENRELTLPDIFYFSINTSSVIGKVFLLPFSFFGGDLISYFLVLRLQE